jgi:teichuronic acid biosynthesis glycosyltransferase TuaC
MNDISALDGRRPLKVLVLSRSYPNNVMDLLGLWVERVVHFSTRFCEPKVVSPAPYCPPLPGLPESYSRFRRVERRRSHGGVEVFHPRFFAGPGYCLYNFEWRFYYAGVRRLIDRLRRDFAFDLIHAHFTYPDGVVATQLGRRYGVPVIITEHIPWDIWDQYPRVRQRAAQAVQQCSFHVSVSESVRKSVEKYVGKRENLVVIPNAVDGSVFNFSPGRRRVENRILFVGAVRPIKGVDVLLKAMRLLADKGRDANLVVVGEAFYEAYRREEGRLRQMVKDLQLEERVQFIGKKAPAELSDYIQESSVLVLPSRAESFGMVLVEALACGTPVVATRCGGPEDIVSEKVGVLAPPEDPHALARAIEHVLDRRADYDPAELRTHALENFGLESVGRRLAQLYQEASLHFYEGRVSGIERGASQAPAKA